MTLFIGTNIGILTTLNTPIGPLSWPLMLKIEFIQPFSEMLSQMIVVSIRHSLNKQETSLVSVQSLDGDRVSRMFAEQIRTILMSPVGLKAIKMIQNLFLSINRTKIFKHFENIFFKFSCQ